VQSESGSQAFIKKKAHHHVLQARPVLNEISPNSHNAHLQVLLEYERGDSLVQTWATINVRAGQDEVFYTIDDDYRHPITNVILNAGLSQGFNKLDSKSGGVALDYIREKLVDMTTMEKLQHVQGGVEDDDGIEESIRTIFKDVDENAGAELFIFGSMFKNGAKFSPFN
jgi:uncharacterized protein YukJ